MEKVKDGLHYYVGKSYENLASGLQERYRDLRVDFISEEEREIAEIELYHAINDYESVYYSNNHWDKTDYVLMFAKKYLEQNPKVFRESLKSEYTFTIRVSNTAEYLADFTQFSSEEFASLEAEKRLENYLNQLLHTGEEWLPCIRRCESNIKNQVGPILFRFENGEYQGHTEPQTK